MPKRIPSKRPAPAVAIEPPNTIKQPKNTAVSTAVSIRASPPADHNHGLPPASVTPPSSKEDKPPGATAPSLLCDNTKPQCAKASSPVSDSGEPSSEIAPPPLCDKTEPSCAKASLPASDCEEPSSASATPPSDILLRLPNELLDVVMRFLFEMDKPTAIALMQQNKRMYKCGLKEFYRNIQLNFNHIDWVSRRNDGTLDTLLPIIAKHSKSFDVIVPDTSVGHASFEILLPRLQMLSPVRLRLSSSYLPQKLYMRLNMLLGGSKHAQFRKNLKEVWLPSMSEQDASEYSNCLLKYQAIISFTKGNDASLDKFPSLTLGFSGNPRSRHQTANGPPIFAISPVIRPYKDSHEYTGELTISGLKEYGIIMRFPRNPFEDMDLGTPARPVSNIRHIHFHRVDFTSMPVSSFQSVKWFCVSSLIIEDCLGINRLFRGILNTNQEIIIQRLIVDVRTDSEHYTDHGGPGDIGRLLGIWNKLTNLMITSRIPWKIPRRALNMHNGLVNCVLDPGGTNVDSIWLSQLVKHNANLTALGFPCEEVTETLISGCDWKIGVKKLDEISVHLVKLRQLRSITIIFHETPVRVYHPDPKNLGHLGAYLALACLIYKHLKKASADAGYGSCSIEEICLKRPQRPANEIPELRYWADELLCEPGQEVKPKIRESIFHIRSSHNDQFEAQRASRRSSQRYGAHGLGSGDDWINTIEAHHAGDVSTDDEY